jgi:hypothetical protein
VARSDEFAAGVAEHYRDVTPRLTSSIPGVTHVRRADAPADYTALHDRFSPNNDKHGEEWSYAPRRTIQPGETIHTTQDAVGAEHVDRYGAGRRRGAKTAIDFRRPGSHEDEQDTGEPRLVQLGGKLWHMDGLHRVGAARDLGRPFKARVVDIDAARDRASSYSLPHPERGYGTLGHLLDDHVQDNAAMDERTDASPREIDGYHAELHRNGLADHVHH